MKVKCEACGGRVKVVKSAVAAELGADMGLVLAFYLGVQTGGMAIPALGPALYARKQLFKTVKKNNGAFFKCGACGKEASNKRVLGALLK